MKLKLILLFMVLMLVSFPTGSSATLSSDILVSIAPENPAPYEDVSISLNSYVNNLDGVPIIWSVNGKNFLSGVGKKSFSLKAPAAGSVSTVFVVISLPNGDVETKITIRPSVMVLLWQAIDSFVPPFYKGKAMPTPDSEIKLVAMPEIKTDSGFVNPKNMLYFWKENYTNNVDGSGYGKNAFIHITDYLEDSSNISVTVSTVDQNYSSNASVDITTIQPKILFYKNDPVLGTLWEQALPDGYKIQGGETIEALPYFISPKEIQNPRLIWNWFINDNMVRMAGVGRNFMPLKAEEGAHGTSKIRLEINNMDKIFETANREITIEF